MKKNYSNPKFKLVILDSNDIVCISGPEYGGNTTGDVTRTDAKQRNNNIWDE